MSQTTGTTAYRSSQRTAAFCRPLAAKAKATASSLSPGASTSTCAATCGWRDWRNDRIQRFSPDGEFLAKYGSPGQGDGELHRPSSAVADEDGYIYVADWGNERVQVLDPDGGFVTKLRGKATVSKWGEDFLRANIDESGARARSDLEPDPSILEPDPHEQSSHVEKLFWGPSSVKLDSEGRLYVVDRNRHRIQVYRRT